MDQLYKSNVKAWKSSSWDPSEDEHDHHLSAKGDVYDKHPEHAAQRSLGDDA